eukprot:9357370-Pyramimonas_sp.AAC.1
MHVMVMMSRRRKDSSSKYERLWPPQLREPLAAQGCGLCMKAARVSASSATRASDRVGGFHVGGGDR